MQGWVFPSVLALSLGNWGTAEQTCGQGPPFTALQGNQETPVFHPQTLLQPEVRSLTPTNHSSQPLPGLSGSLLCDEGRNGGGQGHYSKGTKLSSTGHTLIPHPLAGPCLLPHSPSVHGLRNQFFMLHGSIYTWLRGRGLASFSLPRMAY